MSVISSGGQFESANYGQGRENLGCSSALPMSLVGQNAMTGAQIVGSITLCVVLLLFLFFDRHARIPNDGRYRDDPSVTGQFMPVEKSRSRL